MLDASGSLYRGLEAELDFGLRACRRG